MRNVILVVIHAGGLDHALNLDDETAGDVTLDAIRDVIHEGDPARDPARDQRAREARDLTAHNNTRAGAGPSGPGTNAPPASPAVGVRVETPHLQEILHSKSNKCWHRSKLWW